jgi:hypothetical protein
MEQMYCLRKTGVPTGHIPQIDIIFFLPMRYSYGILNVVIEYDNTNLQQLRYVSNRMLMLNSIYGYGL